MVSGIKYIARIPANGKTVVQIIRALGENFKARRFNLYCEETGCTVQRPRNGASNERNENSSPEAKPLTYTSLIEMARLDERVTAETAFLDLPMFRKAVAKVLERSMSGALMPELIQRLVEDHMGNFGVLMTMAPDFKAAGLPLDLVKSDINEVMLDSRAGVVGIWRRYEPGQFWMGSPKDRRIIAMDDPFLMSVFLFTNGQALQIRKGRKLCEFARVDPQDIRNPYAHGWTNGPIRYPAYIKTTFCGVGPDLDNPIEEKLGLPVVGINHPTAAIFAELDGVSLPWNTQWEYAARYDGPKDSRGVVLGDKYPTGPSLFTADGQTLLAHIYHHDGKGNWTSGPAPVGSYPREAGSGIYDMGGNVQELVDGKSARGGFWSRGVYSIRYRGTDREEVGKIDPEPEILQTHFSMNAPMEHGGAMTGFRLALQSSQLPEPLDW